jgi:hypothetical protein
MLVAVTEQHRVIVSFYEHEKAQMQWQFGSIAKVHNQYGRRLVLEFETPPNWDLEITLIKGVIKPNELIEIIEACKACVGQGTASEVFDSKWDKLKATKPYGMHTQGEWKAGLFGRQELVVRIIESGISQSGKSLSSHYVAIMVWQGVVLSPQPT